MKFVQKKPLTNDQCCLCGLKRCVESVDHNFMPLQQFTRLIIEAKTQNKVIDQLKQKANIFYKQLKYQINLAIDEDQKALQQHLNKYYYNQINPKLCNLNDLCQFASGCYEKLPSKKALKIINAISHKKSRQFMQEQQIEIKQLKEELEKYLDKSMIFKQLLKLKKILPFNKTAENNLPQLKPFRSNSSISNPQETDQQQANSYIWKNVQIRSKAKTLELNNKNITDQQLLKQMPKLASFKNFQQLQIRNNKITPFSCQLIANNMQHIKSLDIRGNKIGDQGIGLIVKNMPFLKGFMISQTGITDLSLKLIINKMKSIEKLWCQNNKISGEVALQITNIPTLRMLSFVGCKLDPQMAQKIKTIFYPKGYISL